jgi:N,N'-diacetylchitobiose transport system substrate-binding protein
MPFLFRRRGAVRVVALAVSGALLAGCGLVGDGGGDRALQVWLMEGSLTDGLTRDLVRDYEERHPGVDVEVQVQEWPGIDRKVTAALRSGEGPDVIEVGNTQVAQYVETGRVQNLTIRMIDLGSDEWLPALAGSGQVDGYQYGVPFYAANRVVVYRKDLFSAAGIDDPPRSREEWLTATAALDSPPGQQGIYLPGQNWYVLAGFVWDEGGRLAVERSGRWSGTLDSPEALRAMDFYRQLQSHGEATADSDEADPDQEQVFAEGRVAQLITVPGSARLITEANPGLKGKLGFFPVPGRKPGRPGAVFTGGSVLIMPDREGTDEDAYAFVKLLSGDRWQRRVARTMSYVPNKAKLADALSGDPGAEAMARAAERGHAVPASPSWGDLEADNPIKRYMTAVLRGEDPEAAARRASATIGRVLNGTG